MSEAIEYHEYFGELLRDIELGGWTGELLFPPTMEHVQIFIPGEAGDPIVPLESVRFFDELISLYPEISKEIQVRLYDLREEFDDMNSMDDVWSIFQLECVDLDDVRLEDSKSWRLAYGTDYGGYIYGFNMRGKTVKDISQDG